MWQKKQKLKKSVRGKHFFTALYIYYIFIYTYTCVSIVYFVYCVLSMFIVFMIIIIIKKHTSAVTFLLKPHRNNFDVALYSVWRNKNLSTVKFLYLDLKPFSRQHPFTFKYKALLCQHKCHGNCWELCNICLSVLTGNIINVLLWWLIVPDCTLVEATITYYTLCCLLLCASSHAKWWHDVCEKLDVLVVFTC